ncbi:hypothetical protein [Halomonas organivorans]|uniref:Uncharacterized protein n=1 Tax=Halomonas organivorans TaxID=257772 RepID=A0A7W5BXV1_9GAMM|nr:hypothetical protein [Halomonas organivorans]MBB3141075.1 hypothetical protein [Halomonas organivorans]
MNTRISRHAWMGLAIGGLTLGLAGVAVAQEEAPADKLQDALSATWPGMAEGAAVVDWQGKGLQEGGNGYTCLPSPPDMAGNAPMCLDEAWMAWAKAWQNKEPFTADRLGIAYMLQGDAGASNLDPFAMEATDDNQWVVEGPHLMIIAPPALLEAFPTDPDNGGPYVMWKGTDYQHLMVPVAARPMEQDME